jgi:hypothetical protein
MGGGSKATQHVEYFTMSSPSQTGVSHPVYAKVTDPHNYDITGIIFWDQHSVKILTNMPDLLHYAYSYIS